MASTYRGVARALARVVQTKAPKRTLVQLQSQAFAPTFQKPITWRSLSTSPPTVGSGDASDPTKGFEDVPGTKLAGDKFTMVYTCNVCETRAAKTISKNAYDNGVVLVRCPGCENLHLVADRLGWFDDDSTDVESILSDKGEQVRVVTGDNVLELTDKDLLGDKAPKDE